MFDEEFELTDWHRHDRNDDDREPRIVTETQSQHPAHVIPAGNDRMSFRRFARQFDVEKLIFFFLVDQILMLFRNVVDIGRRDAIFASTKTRVSRTKTKSARRRWCFTFWRRQIEQRSNITSTALTFRDVSIASRLLASTSAWRDADASAECHNSCRLERRFVGRSKSFFVDLTSHRYRRVSGVFQRAGGVRHQVLEAEHEARLPADLPVFVFGRVLSAEVTRSRLRNSQRTLQKW